jgi:hypothetical protein
MYDIALNSAQAERDTLQALLSGRNRAARKLKRAQILLAAAAGASAKDEALLVATACSSHPKAAPVAHWICWRVNRSTSPSTIASRVRTCAGAWPKTLIIFRLGSVHGTQPVALHFVDLLASACPLSLQLTTVLDPSSPKSIGRNVREILRKLRDTAVFEGVKIDADRQVIRWLLNDPTVFSEQRKRPRAAHGRPNWAPFATALSSCTQAAMSAHATDKTIGPRNKPLIP